MYHKSVIVKKAEDSKPMTREMVSVLKKNEHKVEQAREAGVVPTSSLWSHVADIWTLVLYGFRPKNKQCITYGHTLPSTGWVQGRKPKCADCGDAISDPDELRRSLPRW